MNSRQRTIAALLLALTLGLWPAVAGAAEMVNEVLLVVKDDEVLAFSGLKNNWVSQKLSPNEKVLAQRSRGNVAVVTTKNRLLGFSAFSAAWSEVSLRVNELVEDLQADGNVATVVTDLRIFGFNAHTGLWIEAD